METGLAFSRTFELGAGLFALPVEPAFLAKHPEGMTVLAEHGVLVRSGF
jgi:hypothetical protein